MSFPQFAKLPMELRRMIWQFCIPNRVIEVQMPSEMYREDYPHKINCEMLQTSTVNKRPPIITRVCREARRVAMEDLEARGISAALAFRLGHLVKPTPVWANPRQDVVFFQEPHGDDVYDEREGSELDYDLRFFDDCFEGLQERYQERDELVGRRTERLRRLAEDIRTQAVVGVMQQFEGDNLGLFCDRVKDFSDPVGGTSDPIEDASDPVEGASDATVLVCVKVICIHSSLKAALDFGCLFGRLGDAPIALIRADERETILQYRAFWDAHGEKPETDTVPADFFAEYCLQENWAEEATKNLLLWCVRRSSCWSFQRLDPVHGSFDRNTRWKAKSWGSGHELDWEHPWVKKVLQWLPKFRPAVMFRLCTSSCPQTREDADDSDDGIIWGWRRDEWPI